MYQPVLHFHNLETSKTLSFEFDGGDFLIPSNLTYKMAGVNAIIYSLREDITEDIGEGNVGWPANSDTQEIFVSSVFYGVIHPTLDIKVEDVKAEDGARPISDTQTHQNLNKPPIIVDFNSQNDGRISLSHNN